MRTERRLRYYCDHCKKSGGQAAAMISHESACTKNPDRVCKMCALIDSEDEQVTLAELMAVLPIPDRLQPDNADWYQIRDELRLAIQKLRELAQGCPACMLAALRQKGVCADSDIFDFKAEMKVAFDGAIKARHDDERYFY